ncbi:MAG TPA: prephenate dehydratase, partial [bacterium]
MKKIAFQGEKGAFSEDAATRHFGTGIIPLPCLTFKEVFRAVASAQCAYGVIPIENSQTGSIHQNVDLLLEFNLHVVGEIVLKIHHCLLALRGVRLSQVRTVHSHPQALEQCSQYLGKLKNVEIIPSYDTAGSARHVAEAGLRDAAAVASLRAGTDYGLHVLAKGIENHELNFTRFLFIAKKSVIPPKGGKTSVVFSTKDIPGALFKALSVFALRDINLLKIESRPLRRGPFRYWFYMDFEGSIREERCRNAINHLLEITHFMKV